MNLICETLVALGLSASWMCGTPPDRADVFDEQSDDVFGYSRPGKQQADEPPLAMPPIIIEKPAPKPKPQSKAKPKAPPPAKPSFDPTMLEQLQKSIDARRRALRRRTSSKALTGEQATTPPISLAGFTVPAPQEKIKGSAKNPKGYPMDVRYDGPSVTSSFPIDNTRIFTVDRTIVAILERSINSQINSGEHGRVVFVTPKDTYGYHGRSVLIPRGSRFVCKFEAPKTVSTTRLAVLCSDVFLGGTRHAIKSPSVVLDQQGRTGITGRIDYRFIDQYGAALTFAGISAAVTGAAQAATDAADSKAIGKGAEDLAQKFGQITAAALEKTVDIRPVITIPQGTRVLIMPLENWHIKKVDE